MKLINPFLLAGLFVLLSASAWCNGVLQPPVSDKPLEMSVTLFINKIFNINSVDETYQIDGYLEFAWHDERVRNFEGKELTSTLIFENDVAVEVMNSTIWVPAFELMNIQGSIEIPNRSVELHPSGKVIYDIRFFGAFSTEMNFRSFPFDTQVFEVVLEPFTFDVRYMVFKKPRILPELEKKPKLLSSWIIQDMRTRLEKDVYDNPEDPENPKLTYSKVVFEIKAERMTGYYLWQVLFPLFIIIMASFVIFWIHDFSTQLGVGFTLMLTVVAFNFYSASILPQLPYQTFIETIIIVGYVFIFLGILAVIVNSRLYGKTEKSEKSPLLRILRFVFPVAFLVAIFSLYFLFHKSK
ncbi:hypothetical protein INQ51_10420 [Maribellus sp. CM-23]|uniref:hypothetical protein n=1 Tax=Maribellus sp. CM-23 TaxID=2781026 RepID=UPI001F353930|nr:hypothetical protein [Maribellus sp. CM-23]MCE4564725.1 hypothetical protein [Maribellus sp. CM-23]